MAVPAKFRNLKDKVTKPKRFEVEKGQVRRFAAAIGETDPIHFDEDVAKAAGFPSLVGPTAFPSCFHAHEELMEIFGLDNRATMHAEEEYEYFKPICAGDVLDVQHRVVDVYDKDTPNGNIVFVVIETRATTAKDQLVFKGRRVLVELRK